MQASEGGHRGCRVQEATRLVMYSKHNIQMEGRARPTKTK